jgi:hypothetical protein
MISWRKWTDRSLRRGSTTATTESTTERWSELARGTTLLALLVTTTVTAVTTVTTRTAAATRTTLTTVITAHHTTRRSMRALLFDVSSRDNLSGEMKPFAEVVKTLRSKGVVVVLPWEAGLDVATGVEGLASLDHLWNQSSQ